MFVVFFAVTWQIFPATGYVSPDVSLGGWLASITLPVAALALSGIASATQQVRGAVIDVLEADFVRTLRSRGLSDRSILFRHALKNAASPALTVLSLQFIGLLGGAIVIEKVFALPGLDRLRSPRPSRATSQCSSGSSSSLWSSWWSSTCSSTC